MALVRESTFERCRLHVPHKDWSDNVQEHENYAALERWARTIMGPDGRNGNGFVTTDRIPTLHFPHKDWNPDPFERENYSAIERWARTIKSRVSGAALNVKGFYSQSGSGASGSNIPIQTSAVFDSDFKPVTVDSGDLVIVCLVTNPNLTLTFPAGWASPIGGAGQVSWRHGLSNANIGTAGGAYDYIMVGYVIQNATEVDFQQATPGGVPPLQGHPNNRISTQELGDTATPPSRGPYGMCAFATTEIVGTFPYTSTFFADPPFDSFSFRPAQLFSGGLYVRLTLGTNLFPATPRLLSPFFIFKPPYWYPNTTPAAPLHDRFIGVTTVLYRQTGTVRSNDFGLLHIPHKEWSGDPHERENYLAIERWANPRHFASCFGP